MKNITQIKNFMKKALSVMTIAAIIGMYVQPAFLAYADDGSSTSQTSSTASSTKGGDESGITINSGSTVVPNVSAGTDPQTLTISQVVMTSPNGMVAHAGDSILVDLIDSSTTDGPLTVDGSCTINNVPVNFSAASSNTYALYYLVGANDASQAAGTIPLNCTVENTSGSMVDVTAYTTPNTVAIDTSSTSGSGTTASSTASSTSGDDQSGITINSGSTTVPLTGGGGESSITINGSSTASSTKGGDESGITINSGSTTVPLTGGVGESGITIDGSSTASTSTPTSTTGGSDTAQSVIYSGNGGGGGGGIGGGFSAPLASASSTIAGALSCPFMTGYVLPGRVASAPDYVNDPAQIRKLQVFLNAYEGDAAVTVTGVLDQPTISGILAFQEKYLNQTMGPWGSTSPSGNVYITTLREINSLVCGSQPSLTPAQQAVINAYLASVAASANTGRGATSGNTANTRAATTTGSTTIGAVPVSTVNAATTTPNNSLLTGNVVSSGAGNFFGSLFSKIFNFFRGK